MCETTQITEPRSLPLSSPKTFTKKYTYFESCARVFAVVTGATDGIGKEYARQVSNGDNGDGKGGGDKEDAVSANSPASTA